jgi:hypothetical protein
MKGSNLVARYEEGSLLEEVWSFRDERFLEGELKGEKLEEKAKIFGFGLMRNCIGIESAFCVEILLTDNESNILGTSW